MTDPFEENLESIRPTRFGSVIVVVLCLILIFSITAYGAVDTWATGLLALCCALVVWLWLAESWKLRAFNFNSNPAQLAIIGLLLIGLIQLLPLRGGDLSGVLSVPFSHTLSLDPFATKFAVINLLLYLIFFAAALNFIVTQKRFRRVVMTIIIFGAVMAVFAIFQKLLNPDNIYGTRQTVQASTFGPFVNGHHFAALMEMTLGLSLGLLYGKTVKKELRVIFLVAAVLMGIAIIMTGSRGGLLSFFGVLALVTIFAFLRKRNKAPAGGAAENSGRQGKLLLLGGGLAFALLIAGGGLLLGGDTALFRGLGIENVGADVSNGRLHFWYVALQIFQDNFLLGTGLDSFGVAFTKYDTWNGAFRIEQAHNDYLQILADAGIPGLACVLGFIYLLFKRGVRKVTISKDRFRCSAATGALAGCFGILIHSFFDFPLRTPANAFVFLTLAALAMVSVPQSESHRK
jgi:O-antigen ligase